jgi:predicted CXXCH cytochrome family protein
MQKSRRSYSLALLLLILILAAVVAGDWYFALPSTALTGATFVGRSACAECHAAENTLWLGSHHDRAMELATDETVLGDFNDATFQRLGVTTRFFRRDGQFMVNIEGPDGQNHDYQIKYTFGIEPLQQYMVEMERGRVQVLRVSWDTLKSEWFEVTPPDVPNERLAPDDPLHWTRIAQNWNTTCADCHSTNVQKNYDSDTDSYHTTYTEIDVSCEECHGPGSVHVALARGWSLFWDRNVGYGLPQLKTGGPEMQLQLCAKCHSRRAQIAEGYRTAAPLMDHYVPATLSTGLYHDDGQILDEVYEYGSFLQSKMYAQKVKCTDCHNPHSLQLRFTGNRLCVECHVPAKYDTPAHHHHSPESPGAQCVECHMPARLYMVIDSRRDHSFRVPRPDLSASLGTPNACNDCHTAANETPEWAADAVRRWYGEKRSDDPHWAPAFAAARQNRTEAQQLLLELVERKTTPSIVRATAIELLANIETAGSVASRQKALVDFQPLVRYSAVQSAGGDRWPTLEWDLYNRLFDPERAVRSAAAVRLAYLPRESFSDDQNAKFAEALSEFRSGQSLSLDHAGGRLAMAALDRHFAERALSRGQQRIALPLIERAMAHWRAAIRIEPYFAGPRGELATLLGELGGDAAEIRRLREEEAELLARDAALLPESDEVRYRLGMLLVLLGRLTEATDALGAACRLRPNDYSYRMALALVLERQFELTGDEAHFDAAARELATLQRQQPRDPRAGQILERMRQMRQAKLGGDR